LKLLAIETATEACSCALRVEGEVLSAHEVAPRRHAELILGMVSRLLGEAGFRLRDLDGVAFGRGPGSFTGVRIAAAVAQGLAFGAERAVVPVSSLNALAQGALRERGARRVLAAFDARMGEVYWGAYEADAGDRMRPLVEECVCAPGDVPVPAAPHGWLGSGGGWGVHAEALRAALGAATLGEEPARRPHAVDVATLGADVLARGGGVAPDEALPVYLRDQVVRRRAP